MALINLDTAFKRIIMMLKKMESKRGVEILSYKRNRGVVILRLSEAEFFVRQRGYEEAEYIVSFEGLTKILKSILKQEFPRSRKVRIYIINRVDEMGAVRKKI